MFLLARVWHARRTILAKYRKLQDHIRLMNILKSVDFCASIFVLHKQLKEYFNSTDVACIVKAYVNAKRSRSVNGTI